MKTFKLNRLEHDVVLHKGVPAQTIGHLVSVPYIKAFAAKEGKEWYVYEYSTGLKITAAPYRTKWEAVIFAKERLLQYGEEAVLQAISTKEVINT